MLSKPKFPALPNHNLFTTSIFEVILEQIIFADTNSALQPFRMSYVRKHGPSSNFYYQMFLKLKYIALIIEQSFVSELFWQILGPLLVDLGTFLTRVLAEYAPVNNDVNKLPSSTCDNTFYKEQLTHFAISLFFLKLIQA